MEKDGLQIKGDYYFYYKNNMIVMMKSNMMIEVIWGRGDVHFIGALCF